MLGIGGRHAPMGSGRRRRSWRLVRGIRHLFELRNLLRGALALVALAVILASLAGPPSDAMIVRANLPAGEAEVAEEPADELAAWTAVPSLSASPRFELAVVHQPVKRQIAVHPLPAPPAGTSSASSRAPCSAKKSHNTAHFSTSARACVTGLPISAVARSASASRFARSSRASATKYFARSLAASARHRR